jgi:hypothetical protein
MLKKDTFCIVCSVMVIFETNHQPTDSCLLCDRCRDIWKRYSAGQIGLCSVLNDLVISTSAGRDLQTWIYVCVYVCVCITADGILFLLKY